MAHLRALDYLVIAVYLAGIMFIGLRMAGRQKTTSEYFVARHRIPTWALAFSLMATIISSVTFVAHPAAVFQRNFWLLMVNLAWPPILIVVAMVVVPFYRNVVGMSAYEYIGKRFGVGARVYSSLSFIINRIQDLGFTIYTTVIAVSVMSGWNIQAVILIFCVFTVIYTMIGGIEGVIWTDIVQGFVLVGGGLFVLYTALFGVSGGPAAIVSTAWHAGKFGFGDFDFSWQSLYKDPATAWVLLAVGIIGVLRGYTADQSMVQRYLVARTDRSAKIGVFTGSLVCLPIWLMFAFIGACLWSFYNITGNVVPKEIMQRPDNILPYFVVTQLPVGVVGMILAAILAAAQSSISADLNSVATVLTADYFVQMRPQSSDRARLLFGKLAVLASGMVCSAVALLLTLAKGKGALELGVILWMVVSSGVLGLFGLGFLTRSATRTGAYVGIAACVLFTAWGVVTGPLKVDLGFNYRMNSMLIGVWGQFVMFGAGYAASRICGGYCPDLEGLTIWTRRAKSPGRS